MRLKSQGKASLNLFLARRKSEKVVAYKYENRTRIPHECETMMKRRKFLCSVGCFHPDLVGWQIGIAPGF
jgi:hypothetical protein